MNFEARNPKEAYAEAVRRIRVAADSGVSILDLGDLTLKHLPIELGQLNSLRVLVLGVFVPVEHQEATKWERDWARSANRFENLSVLSELTNLEALDLSRCDALTDLSALVSLTNLQRLKLSGCTNLIDISPLAGLSNLQTLELSGCEALSDLSPVAKLKRLARLNLVHCIGLANLSPLADLTDLESLDLCHCVALTDISALAGLSNLQRLKLANCGKLFTLSPLAGLTNLRLLDLGGCVAISDFSPVAHLKKLERLSMISCSGLTDLSPLAHLTNLRALYLSRCSAVDDVSHLARLTNLQTLDLSYCEGLTGLSVLAHLTNLQTLDLARCGASTDLSALASLTNLQALNHSHCGALTNLSELARFRKLKTLRLSHCGALSDLSGLAALTTLEMLDLSDCGAVIDLSPLGQLTNLHTLNVSNCRSLTELSGLARLSNIKTLDLYGCRELANLSPLQHMTSLQTLDLSTCRKLSDLSALSALTALRTLNLSRCSGIRDLSALASLTNLQTLKISHCGALTDLSPLVRLGSLQSLDLSHCGALNDLSALARLTDLRKLNLSYCHRLENLTALDRLWNLSWLNLASYPGLTDLSALRQLRNLRWLEVSFCRKLVSLSGLATLENLQALTVAYCRKLTDLSALAKLTNLRTLNLGQCPEVANLSALAQLRELESLHLHFCRRVTDLSALAKLTNLETLTLSGCTQLADISPLVPLTKLQILNLSGCSQIVDLSVVARLPHLKSLRLRSYDGTAPFEPLGEILSRLESLHLYGSYFKDLPPEICGDESRQNVLALVQAHFADIDRAAARDTEIKAFLLGNGGVGKTQLCRRLMGLKADFTIPTTHGIQLGSVAWPWETLETPMRLNLWDFGGQDIYHGSHALFVHGQAVICLLWTPGLESGQLADQGVVMRNRPLPYWVDYVRGLAGTASPTLVIQCQCDRPGMKKTPSGLELEDFSWVKTCEFSALDALSLEIVTAYLKDAVRAVLDKRPPVPIGLGRVRVRDELRRILEADQSKQADDRRRLLTQDEFRTLCAQIGGISSPDALLNYLHHSGLVFHRPGIFEDRIVLDQNWALEAIYTIFHRQQTLPVLTRRHGRFTRRELASLAWSEHSVEDQELFLGMMESCGICFRVRQLKSRGSQSEWEYAAPELLPPKAAVGDELLGRIPDDTPNATASIRYRFLHEGILRGLLSGIGDRVRDAAVYWKYGCWLMEASTNSRLVIDSEVEQDPKHLGVGTVSLRAWGPEAERLIRMALMILRRVPVGQPPRITTSFDAPGIGAMEQVDHDAGGRKSRRSAAKLDGQHSEIESLKFAKPRLVQKPGAPEVFVSYAWGDESPEGKRRDELVALLCGKLHEWGYHVLVDKEALQPGESISRFMHLLGKGDRVVVVLSAKYLRSEYCMSELYEIYQNSRSEGEEFRTRVIPLVLNDAEIGSLQQRLQCRAYWTSQVNGIRQFIEATKTDLGSQSAAQFQQMRLWAEQVDNILYYINDGLMPQGFEHLVATDFCGVLDLLPPATS